MTAAVMMLRTFLVKSMIRFIKIAKWIRIVRIINRLFNRIFNSFLDDFQNFFNLITDFIFIIQIDLLMIIWLIRFIRKQFRFRFKHECFKLDFEAVWSLVRFISKELCQLLWHLEWDQWLNWQLIVLSRLLSCLFVSCSLRKLLCCWWSCGICSGT